MIFSTIRDFIRIHDDLQKVVASLVQSVPREVPGYRWEGTIKTIDEVQELL